MNDQGQTVEPLSDASRFALLLELSRGFNAHTELDTLLPAVIARTREVLNAEGSSLLLVDDEAEELYFPLTSSQSAGVDAQLEEVRFPVADGIAGAVVRTGQPLRVVDAGKHELFYSGVDRLTGSQTRDLLCAPLRTHSGVIGAIEVVNSLGAGFSEADLEFLDALAGSVAIAVENARLIEALRMREQRLQHEVTSLRRERVRANVFPEIIGSSAAIQRVLSLMESAVDSTITVQLRGETGVGKEVVARAIHSHGPRGDQPWIALDCGAMPPSLIESELFGFSRGAFTGAQQDKAGLFEAADGGTLFLDEIDSMSLDQQAKLLRVIQEGELRRLGETRTRRVDIRIISATNRDLAQEVRENRFREDLYYRLNVFPIEIPPLRERREDIAALAASLLQRAAARHEVAIKPIELAALDTLSVYDWPGNVRELENELERATALSGEGSAIKRKHLSDHVLMSGAGSPSSSEPAPSGAQPDLQTARRDFERQFVAAVLDRCDGNATHAAQELGISRQMLQRKIRDYGLREPSRRSSTPAPPLASTAS